MNIHFRAFEMADFLQRRGYTVTTEPVEQHWHIHGSRFMTETNAVTFAEKNGKKVTLDEAFEFEMKHKLLEQ